MFKLICIVILFGCFNKQLLPAQTIAEKKAGMVTGGESELSPEMRKFLIEVNKELNGMKGELSRLQHKVTELYESGAPPESYRSLLLQINEVKENIRILESNWRELASLPERREESYALWQQPETTIEQLINDYGSSDYVYLIAPDIASIKLSVSSNIPIPHAVWGEMLEQILLQNGVGIKELNPYLRALYPVNKDLSNIRLITNNPRDLEAYPSNARISFVLTPEPLEVRRAWYFLEKFVNSNSTVLQRIGRVILIVGEVSDIKNLLKIYDFVASNKRELDYKAVPLLRVDAEEMANILSAIFTEFAQAAEVEVEAAPIPEPGERGRMRPIPPPSRPMPKPKRGQEGDSNALNVIALPKVAQAIFLIGTKEEIKKATDIIADVESQVAGARQKEVFMYHVRHSDAEELATVLERVYIMMITNRIQYINPEEAELKRENLVTREREDLVKQEAREMYENLQPTPLRVYQQSYYQQGGYLVNPRPAEPGLPERKEFNKNRDNFIVDPKTGLLVMVVESDLVQKLKDVIKRLDVPKKMVQVDVMLFEKTMTRENDYGLAFLKMGSNATQSHKTGLTWDGSDAASMLGVLQFFLSRPKSSSGFPAFDLSYKFLMSQDDVHIKSTPSIVTMNQTPATISIVEEISVRTGVYQVETTGGVTLENAFTRAQYGTTITVTPTIHTAEDEERNDMDVDYVTLNTDITFDTFSLAQEDATQQPDVTRRHVTNEVRVPDGQTVIIGGLRRKDGEEINRFIPFLGEIPYVGKLFSYITQREDDTEMIIFLTPKIISEPCEDFARLRQEEMCKRPGDLPMFLYRLNTALEQEQKRLFQGFMTMVFGQPGPRYVCEEGEFDGRCH